jgi:class 3 adenylate cyclase
VIAGRSPNRAAPAQAARETILRRSECALLQAEFPQAERISRDVDPEDFIRLHADLVQKLQAIPVTTDDSVISLCCAGSTLLFSGRERPEQNCEAAMEAAGRVLAGYQTVFRAFIDPGQPICRFGLASGHASHGVVQAGDRNWGIAVGRPVAEAAELVSRSNDGQVALGRHSRMLLGRCPGLNQSPIEEVASGLWRIGLRDAGDGCLRS